MEADAISEGGQDLVTFREAARRVVAEKIAPTMTHQRISQLASTDENFPPVQQIGRSKVADWRLLKPYFEAHAKKAAIRDSRRRVEGKEGRND